jgi:membrane-bound lytic murein transglycosylase
MRRSLVAFLLLVFPITLSAQGGGDSAAEAGVIRQRIRQRWHEHIVTQLQLNQDQSAKLQATEDKFDGMRQPIQQRQVAIAGELNQQLQPGVAANNDVVTRLMAERQDNRAKLQEIDRQQDQEMTGYLTPVQRVRYQRQKEMFTHRIQQAREGRQEGRPLRPRRIR